MTKRFCGSIAAIIFFALSISSALAQQKPDPKKNGSALAGKDYVSMKLGPRLWHIEDTVQEVYRNSMYLVEGTEKAALIDTGMGSGDLPGYVRTLTKLPVIVLITHGHGDHTGQAGQFETIYFPQKEAGSKLPFNISRTMPLADGQKIDIGGKELEVIEIPGHTTGSVAFLDAKDRMIFTGDAIGSGYVWNHISGARPLAQYLEAVRKLETRMGEFDGIYGGHYWQSGYRPLPASYVSDMRKATEGVFSGDIVAKSYTAGGQGWASTYGTATVIYNPANLYESGKQNKGEYTLSEAVPGVIRVRDYQGFNFAYIAKGKNKVAIIDTAMGEGNLRAIVEKHAGGLPVELILTHGHIDHAFSANQFKTAYMNHRDKGILPQNVDSFSLMDIKAGHVFDLGGITLKAYDLPGHTAGSMVFVSPEMRLLFTGDAVGTQSNKGGLWLQLPGCLYVDEYQDVLKDFIAKTAGQFDSILTGHNAGLVGPKYLDYMVLAAQKVIDQGDAALVPSVRPAGIKMVYYGEDSDPYAASINVSPDHVLSGKQK
jgi:hydroxyacylglutathione hydrolase